MNTIATPGYRQIGQIAQDAAAGAGQQDTSGAPSFSATLANALESVNTQQNDANAQAQAFALGQTNDIHSVMIAAQKATVSLDLVTEIRSKVLEAYQQVMQMQM